MTTSQIAKDLSWVTAKINQQNRTHKENQQTTPRTGICTGCGSTRKTKPAYQVTACDQCATFMRGILGHGIHKLICNDKGAGHMILSTPEHPYIDKRPRAHCARHRLIQLLAKGFNGPQLENIAIGGNEQIHREMRRALFIGSVKVAGEKYGFHETENSTSIDRITKELHMTEDCNDFKQMVGSLAKLQKEQPPPNPHKPKITLYTPNTHKQKVNPYNTSTRVFDKDTTPVIGRVIQLTSRASYTHKTWEEKR